MNELLRALADHGDTLGISAMLVTALGLFFRQVATGRLVFATRLEEIRVDCAAEIERTIVFYDKLLALKSEQAASWETAYKNEAAASADQRRISQEQLELARAADYMLKALPKPASHQREGSG